ncbi:magnesium transporter MgtC [Rhizobium sp. ACO-34A]|nr:DUF4010 domain-containing protein [Rhizobium sp. ACO-34A]ATN35426.1 magnesium transporter MgtC [Rhizobium sp. ACO-34A]
MDNVELFQRLGLAIAIGAAVGVERHWREREEPEGARAAGIRTFTMIGMTGGVAGLLESSVTVGTAYTGFVIVGFLIVVAIVMAIFELRQAIAEQSYSVTSVIAAILTFGLGALAVTGDMVLASAGGVSLVAILASREFLHSAIRKLKWIELRSAIILLTMTFVLLPILPSTPVGPYGGVVPRSVVLLAITLASISFVGYIAVRMLGASLGDLVGGAVGGLVSSTGTTVEFARRSKELEEADASDAVSLAAGAVAAGAVSLLRTIVLVGALAISLLPHLLVPLALGTGIMAGYAMFLARRQAGAAGERSLGNPFELMAVAKMAALLTIVAFIARAATVHFGSAGLMAASAISALADVDAVAVTVAGMLPSLDIATAGRAVGVAVVTNMSAKAVYALAFGRRNFAMHILIATVLAVGAGLVAERLQAVS